MKQTLLLTSIIGITMAIAISCITKVKKDEVEIENKNEAISIEKEKIELQYFGEINLNKTNDYYDVTAIINEQEISIDLTFDKKNISKKTIQPTINFLERLTDIEKKANDQILSDFKNGNVVKNYIAHHIEEFNTEELKSLGIESNNTTEKKEQQFLSKIHLKRIGIYPEDYDSMVIFDYTIGNQLTQYLIVLQFDSSGHFVDIYTES